MKLDNYRLIQGHCNTLSWIFPLYNCCCCVKWYHIKRCLKIGYSQELKQIVFLFCFFDHSLKKHPVIDNKSKNLANVCFLVISALWVTLLLSHWVELLRQTSLLYVNTREKWAFARGFRWRMHNSCRWTLIIVKWTRRDELLRAEVSPHPRTKFCCKSHISVSYLLKYCLLFKILYLYFCVPFLSNFR